ncbi:type II restriction endonuclease, partial [Olsenella sp. KGMB02461]|nr:type II restriction endonuclease [Olsenella sp. KGMB02461]
MLSEIERSIKRKIEAVSKPLRDLDITINRGILTGCNDAFIIDGATRDRLIAEDPRSAELIRPILRGRDIKRYGYTFADQWIIATFPAKHYAIENYPAIHEFLRGFRPKLEQTGRSLSSEEQMKVANHAAQYGIKIPSKDLKKSRKKTSNKWFETQDTIAYMDDFSKQKIVWGNLCLRSQFAIADEGYMVNAPSPLITPGY